MITSTTYENPRRSPASRRVVGRRLRRGDACSRLARRASRKARIKPRRPAKSVIHTTVLPEGCGIRGASRGSRMATCWSRSAMANSASCAIASSIPKRSRVCPRCTRCAFRIDGSSAASEFRAEPLRLFDLHQGRRARHGRDDAGARKSQGHRLVDVKDILICDPGRATEGPARDWLGAKTGCST